MLEKSQSLPFVTVMDFMVEIEVKDSENSTEKKATILSKRDNKDLSRTPRIKGIVKIFHILLVQKSDCRCSRILKPHFLKESTLIKYK